MNFYERVMELREETVTHRRWLHCNAEVGLHMPAEETFEGAKDMLANGVLEGVDAAWPIMWIPAGCQWARSHTTAEGR